MGPVKQTTVPGMFGVDMEMLQSLGLAHCFLRYSCAPDVGKMSTVLCAPTYVDMYLDAWDNCFIDI